MMSCGMLWWAYSPVVSCFQVPWHFWHRWALSFLVCSMDIQLLHLNFYLSRWPRGYVLKGPHIQVWTVGGFWTWSRSSSKHKTSLQVPCQVNALNHLVHVGSGSSQMSEPQRRFFVGFMIVQSGNQKGEHLQAVWQLNSFCKEDMSSTWQSNLGNTWLSFTPSNPHFHLIWPRYGLAAIFYFYLSMEDSSPGMSLSCTAGCHASKGCQRVGIALEASHLVRYQRQGSSDGHGDQTCQWLPRHRAGSP